MATKHELILQYIDQLSIGEKISVRQIAKDLAVSEGTAYRAIKEAENKGFVSTIERVGTIRIERKKKENFEKLTYAEIVNIVDGQVLGGKEGLHKTLNRFVIGAMKLEAMMRYTEAGNLLIIGNRIKAHELALRAGAAVLVTGGFDTDEEVKELANELQLPIISTSYDTFTVATMINRAIYDQLIKKEIVHVEEILTSVEKTAFLATNDTIERYYTLKEETKHTRFPVVDEQLKVVGIVTAKDAMDVEKDSLVEKVMTRQPMTIAGKTSVAAASHMMVWEGIELLPVVDSYHRLEGVVSRQDVLKALQMIQRQPQIGETIDDIIANSIQEETTHKPEPLYSMSVSPQMTNYLGTLSYGVFTTIVTEVSKRTLRAYKKGELVVESLTIYFIRPVQLDYRLEIKPRLLDLGRKFAKVDVEVYVDDTVVGKAIMMCQLLDRT